MNFIDTMKEKAKKGIKTIVLPESEDIRVLEATEKILTEKFANIVLIGNEEVILKIAADNGINLTGVKIINPIQSEKYDEYVNLFYELRKHKGITIEEATICFCCPCRNVAYKFRNEDPLTFLLAYTKQLGDR